MNPAGPVLTAPVGTAVAQDTWPLPHRKPGLANDPHSSCHHQTEETEVLPNQGLGEVPEKTLHLLGLEGTSNSNSGVSSI